MDENDPIDAPPDPRAERLAEFAARTLPVPELGAARCPDPGVLSGFAEDRLLPGERDVVEAHIAGCDGCRVIAVELERDRRNVEGATPASRILHPTRARRPWRLAVSAAAAVLVAALVVHGLTRATGPSGTEEALVASARDLAAARPDLFRDFRPLRRGEEFAPALAPKRGALALHAPAGKVLDTKPGFRWETVPGVAHWRVFLRTDDGELLWSADTSETSLAFPADRPELRAGTRYIWEASGEGPLGPEGSRRAFDVASADLRRAFEEAGREIDFRAPKALRPLLRAHLAMRKGLYAAAADEAARSLRADPTDAVGTRTLAAAERALGLGDAVSEDR
jgi:hypothetical protein